ncbi:MAG: hypothetical protein J7K94_01565 [Dehalococcoidia bacterium]|nr:hypothetical protein [Dehalococcoidia bacterium]
MNKLKTWHMPPRLYAAPGNIHPSRSSKILLRTYEHKPQNFASLLGPEGAEMKPAIKRR